MGSRRPSCRLQRCSVVTLFMFPIRLYLSASGPSTLHFGVFSFCMEEASYKRQAFACMICIRH